MLLCDTLTHNHKLFLSSHVLLPSPVFEQLLLLQSLSTAPHNSAFRVLPAAPSVCPGEARLENGFLPPAGTAGAGGWMSSSASGLMMLGTPGAMTPAGLFLKKQALALNLNKNDAPACQCFNCPSLPSGFGTLLPFRSKFAFPPCPFKHLQVV